MKKITLGLAAVLLLAAVPVAAFAARIEVQKSVFIPNTQSLPENAYVAGGEVTILSQAQKDISAAGGRIIVNAPVWGDALLFGGTVDVLEQVHGDLRVAGGQVTISSSVGGDVIVLGGQVTINQGVTVAGDLLAVGGEVVVHGAINGDARVYGGDVTIDATVAGPITIKAGKSVTFGSKAVIGSTLSYAAPSEATIADGAKMGDKVIYTKTNLPNLDKKDIAQVLAGVLGFFIVVKFVGLLLAALILTFGFRDFSLDLSKGALEKFWKTAGIGFVVLVVMPIAALMLAISVVGLYLSFLVGVLYVTLLMVSGVYVCILTGALLSRLIRKEVRVNWKWTTLGTVALFVVWLIPVAGAIALFLLYMASIGAVTMSLARDAKAKMTK
jgi:hypothetical protein